MVYKRIMEEMKHLETNLNETLLPLVKCYSIFHIISSNAKFVKYIYFSKIKINWKKQLIRPGPKFRPFSTEIEIR